MKFTCLAKFAHERMDRGEVQKAEVSTDAMIRPLVDDYRSNLVFLHATMPNPAVAFRRRSNIDQSGVVTVTCCIQSPPERRHLPCIDRFDAVAELRHS